VVEIRVGKLIGAGVIVSPDGWIMTAAHVVSGASEVWVGLESGAELPARIHASDPQTVVALLRIPGRAYPCAPTPTTGEDLDLGSDLFAINISSGKTRSPTITRGVLSGFPVHDGSRLIQTDASVNPGSSGGPLFSRDGLIAGITLSKIVAKEIEGIGFAVPIEQALDNLSIRMSDP
jgi:serine protease Do